MAIAVVGVGILLVGLALLGLAVPNRIAARAARWQGPGMLAFAVSVRLGMAALLWLAADACRDPAVVRALAVIAAVAGLSVLAMGSRRLARLVTWWSQQSSAALRLGFALSGVLGVFLIYTAR